MDTWGLVLIFAFAIVTVALINWQVNSTAWPVVRGRINATWPVTGKIEGFVGSAGGLVDAGGINTPALKAWLPSPESVTKQSVGSCPRDLEDAGSYTPGIGKPYKSYDLLSDWLPGKPEPRVAIGPTSQQCYQVDWARGLERAGSYAQRTNNYVHGYPDSCSAPMHDLILDFYKPKPADAPYQV